MSNGKSLKVVKRGDVTVLPAITGQTLIHDLYAMAQQAEEMLKPDGDAGYLSPKDTSTLMAVRISALKEIARITGVREAGNPLDIIPRWNRLRDAIMGALRGFPEAREAVEDAIRNVEVDLK